MGVRSYLANWLIRRGRGLGRSAGYELAVELSDHSIKTTMVDPSDDDLAWDDGLYKHGGVFHEDYANPLKIRVNERKNLEDPDEVELEEGDEEADGDVHTEVISSKRYAGYMRQHLIEQLLTPRSQWKLAVLGIIGLGLLQLLTIILMLFVTGSV